VTTKTRIYIAGAGGMLGEAFHEVFGADYELRCTDKEVNDFGCRFWISGTLMPIVATLRNLNPTCYFILVLTPVLNIANKIQTTLI